MAADSGQKETPDPVCRKRPRKGSRGQRAESAAKVPARQPSALKTCRFLACEAATVVAFFRRSFTGRLFQSVTPVGWQKTQPTVPQGAVGLLLS